MYNKIPEIQIKYKRGDVEKFKISSQDEAASVLRKFFSEDTMELFEECIVVYFDTSMTSIGWFRVSQGGLSATVIDKRLVFATGLKCGASSLIIAHNHPSGNLQPSKSDERITQELVKAGEIIGITVNDHLIITPDGYNSII